MSFQIENPRPWYRTYCRAVLEQQQPKRVPLWLLALSYAVVLSAAWVAWVVFAILLDRHFAFPQWLLPNG